ncbi:hypothetical protein K1719_004543 [Acacia pycnantha]|nr:hypothetical protein K1719_004543 [Acacia pycnantha]
MDYSAASALMGMVWEQTRVAVMVPGLKMMVRVCLALSVMLFVERVYMGIVILLVKFSGPCNPKKCYNREPLEHEDDVDIDIDIELGNSTYPMVYKLSIGAACALSWPSDRIIIQVLDDSTDPHIKEMVKTECKRCESKGALKQGLMHTYVHLCDYVAIFDADFQPQPHFLLQTIPFPIHNPQLALVQARWTFVNADECLMTRMQEMSLDYHFKVEQEVGSSAYGFFGFNGTAGVWRLSA